MAHYEGHLTLNGSERIALIASRYNDFIVSHLIAGATDALVRHGADANLIDLIRAPGAFELPLVAQRIAQTNRYHGIVALGAVMRGDTPHFDFVANEAVKGLAMVSLEFKIPVGFGVLTVDTLEQAIERAGTKAGNKGAEAALAVVETLNLFHCLSQSLK